MRNAWGSHRHPTAFDAHDYAPREAFCFCRSVLASGPDSWADSLAQDELVTLELDPLLIPAWRIEFGNDARHQARLAGSAVPCQ